MNQLEAFAGACCLFDTSALGITAALHVLSPAFLVRFIDAATAAAQSLPPDSSDQR